MRDIIPYSPDEARRIGQIVAKLNIPCPSPENGIALVRMRDGLLKQSEQQTDPQCRALLEDLAHRYTDVATVLAFTQEEIIKRLTAAYKP